MKYILVCLLFLSCTTTAPIETTPTWNMTVFPTLPEMSDMTISDDVILGGELPSNDRIIYPSRLHDPIPPDTILLIGGQYSETPNDDDSIPYIIKDCFQPFDDPDSNIDVDSYMLKKGGFYLGPSMNDQMILAIRYDTLLLYTPLKIHYIKVDGALYKITLVSDFYQRIDADSTKEWYSLPTTIDNFKIK